MLREVATSTKPTMMRTNKFCSHLQCRPFVLFVRLISDITSRFPRLLKRTCLDFETRISSLSGFPFIRRSHGARETLIRFLFHHYLLLDSCRLTYKLWQIKMLTADVFYEKQASPRSRVFPLSYQTSDSEVAFGLEGVKLTEIGQPFLQHLIKQVSNTVIISWICWAR